jgi:hypothetical protein
MNPLTSEWIEKAEGDYATAGRELRVRRQPNYDAVCFHIRLSKWSGNLCLKNFVSPRLLN